MDGFAFKSKADMDRVLKAVRDFERLPKDLLKNRDRRGRFPRGARGRKWHSHQAKTLESMAAGATADVALYIEGADTGETEEATVCPTIQETIPTDTWIRLNWTPTDDGAGRWEIVGYDCS